MVGGTLLHLSLRIPPANLHFSNIFTSLQTMLHLVNNCLDVVTSDISLPSYVGPFLRLPADIHPHSHPICRLPFLSIPVPRAGSCPHHPLQSWCLINIERIGSCPSSKRGNTETLKLTTFQLHVIILSVIGDHAQSLTERLVTCLQAFKTITTVPDRSPCSCSWGWGRLLYSTWCCFGTPWAICQKYFLPFYTSESENGSRGNTFHAKLHSIFLPQN